MKIVITGGHIAPALALIDRLTKKNDTTIVFVGRRYNPDKERSETLEYKEIQKRRLPFHHLHAGRLTRFLSFRSFLNFILTPVGFVEAYTLLKKEKPDVVFSFGGYLALPVAVVAAFLHIPVYTHEQTIRPGIANRLIGKIARKIFIAFPETAAFFPPKKTIVSGNLVRQQIFQVSKRPFTIPQGRPVLYITGGSLGSHSLNRMIENILETLLTKYTVIHQTGNVKEYGDFRRLTARRRLMKKTEKENYFLKEHFLDEEIGYVLHAADVVVGRAGANIIFELIALKKPAVLIPLPWSAHKEQEKHARLLTNAGVAELCHQAEGAENLLAKIEKVISHLSEYSSHFSNLQDLYNANASEIILPEIINNN
ncbi:UDP-N-acetylglucosamine--N-acetylmuramyl-(pentapeptide) pyrophosphoryl-undecaprenol N-acetylglucosamine transferase [Candidatus Roizmanbacteria bacterium]|nr:UDP-N-acetylglucosamine--N-acetylmuramyl-(pentapeptide) pyrophosphoryl-undecaprenol N-acetylglucosamine transferase [Candidatus Roizmanbacteria bacterium]